MRGGGERNQVYQAFPHPPVPRVLRSGLCVHFCPASPFSQTKPASAAPWTPVNTQPHTMAISDTFPFPNRIATILRNPGRLLSSLLLDDRRAFDGKVKRFPKRGNARHCDGHGSLHVKPPHSPRSPAPLDVYVLPEGGSPLGRLREKGAGARREKERRTL